MSQLRRPISYLHPYSIHQKDWHGIFPGAIVQKISRTISPLFLAIGFWYLAEEGPLRSHREHEIQVAETQD
jgi:hypothetical protein